MTSKLLVSVFAVLLLGGVGQISEVAHAAPPSEDKRPAPKKGKALQVASEKVEGSALLPGIPVAVLAITSGTAASAALLRAVQRQAGRTVPTPVSN